MNETQRQIKAYKAALPGLKERVLAVALLLAVSLAMMTSATFAWLTISRRPEVTGVTTNVTANGNLEIALATSENAPGDSRVGDSSAAEGQTLVNSNITWGNLVNLSDPSYGLDNLVLRPAQLNTATLLTSPLYGAEYGEDGRVIRLNSSFGFATWNEATEDKPAYFGVSNKLGVRAISSTKIEAVGAAQTYLKMVQNAEVANLTAANSYASLANDSKYMQSLATMMGHYMTARMNDDTSINNPECDPADLQNLRDMYGAFLDCYDMEAEAIARLIELQLFLTSVDGSYQPWTAEMVYDTSEAKLKSLGVQVTGLNQMIKDRNTIASDWAKLDELTTSGASLKWKDSGINDIVNNLVNVGQCTIGANNTPISSIGASNAAQYLSGTQEARITNGILYRFEQQTGGYIEVKSLSISATVKRYGITVPATVKANIQTTADRSYNNFNNDLIYAKSLNTGNYAGGEEVAEDTYGLAVDLWVRTNAEANYLILEGNVITETETVQATTTDSNGNEVDLYTVTLSVELEDGTTEDQELELYKLTADDGTETWYIANSHTVITAETLGDNEPKLKMVENKIVVGYEGENRIWDDNMFLSTDSTTQGTGSCYIYYADTPEDQARSLKLLEGFNVAFVSDKGEKLATAVMDTEHYYAENGRVIVPLVMSTSDSIVLGENIDGNTVYGITTLEKNVPRRITAIVYLDGTKLTNQDVLAASDIQGQLNIQFGSSQALVPVENEELATKIQRVTATVDKTSFDYDTYEGDMISTVTLNIEGDKPNKVTGFFLRAISDTQGSREDPITFTQQADGTWKADQLFTAPGNYILRSVQLDGQDYHLSDPPTVSISGFAIRSLSCSGATDGQINIMSAASSATVDLTLQFATQDPDKMPKSVQGRFLMDDGTASNINFTYNATSGLWTGSATFLVSGNYTLQYLVLDGEYMEIDAALHQKAHVVLGMRVAVYTTSPHQFLYKGENMDDNQKNLAMQVKITDNAGNEMTGLNGVKLTYTMRGSATKKMDTDLSWNGNYYLGELHTTGAGVWQFGNVVVGSNILTTATTSPTFTIMSPEPPAYFSHYTNANQYAPNNNAVMTAQLTNSSAATVEAKIVRAGTTEEHWVTGSMGATTEDVTNWTFKVPTNAGGYQDGNWQLTQLKVYNAFDASGNEYTEEAPLLIDVSDTGNITKVVTQAFVTFPAGLSKNYGKENGVATAPFMQTHTVSGMSVNIVDFEGEPVANVTDVKLTFTYNGQSDTYGGYTSDSLIAGSTYVDIALAGDGTGTYSQTADTTIQYAGAYETTFQFTIGGITYKYGKDQTYALPTNTPVITVSSVKPTMKISSVTPNGSGATKLRDNGGTIPDYSAIENQTNGKNGDYEATVYARASAVNEGLQRLGIYTAPSITFMLENVPADWTVSVTVPKGTAPAEVTSSRMGSGTLTSNLGVVNSGAHANISIPVGCDTYGIKCDTYTGHGTVEITTIILTKDDVSYTITLTNAVTIVNPNGEVTE